MAVNSLTVSRVVIGMVAALMLCSWAGGDEEKLASLTGGPSGAGSVGVAGPSADDLTALARRDPLAMLQVLRDGYDREIKDCKGLIHRQERINGKLRKSEVIRYAFRRKPFSVYLQWPEGGGDAERILYEPDRLGPKMLVRPSGLAGFFVKTTRIDPHSKDARDASRETVDEFGWVNCMDRIIKEASLAQERGELSAEGVKAAGGGDQDLVTVALRYPKKADYSFGRVEVRFDRRTRLLSAIFAWDWDGRIVERCVFTDVKINVGLDDSDFSPERCGLDG